MPESACIYSAGPGPKGLYTCRTHRGGTFDLGAKFCSKATGLWADLERLNRTMAVKELEDTRKSLEKLGWSFVGFTGAERDVWTATRGASRLTAATGAELVRKVRQALKLEPGPAKQEVLL